MIEVRQTDIYANWFAKLRDLRAKSRIDARVRRLSLGNAGDVKPVGGGISELRVDVGKGYRVYYINHNGSLIILLAGGDKSSQQRDIEKAKVLAADL